MPCQMKQGVKQHGPMAGGKDKAVPIRPARVGGVVLQKASKKRSRGIGHAHGHAGMAGFSLLHPINRQRANGISHTAGIIKRAGKNGRLGGERGVGRVGGGDGGHVWGNLNGCVFSLGAIGRGATSGNRGGGRLGREAACGPNQQCQNGPTPQAVPVRDYRAANFVGSLGHLSGIQA